MRPKVPLQALFNQYQCVCDQFWHLLDVERSQLITQLIILKHNSIVSSVTNKKDEWIHEEIWNWQQDLDG